MLPAASAAMLSACASSRNDVRPPAADPVVTTRVERVPVCPAELTMPLAARPQPVAEAVISGNEPGMAWLTAIISRLGLVEDRLADAAKECP